MIEEEPELYREEPYRRYRDKREIFQEAGNNLTEELYDALRSRLLGLGVDVSVVRGISYKARYGEDEAILADLAVIGVEGDTAITILNESKLAAENALAEEILAKRFPDEVIPSVLKYIGVVQKISKSGAANDDGDGNNIWEREQMYQLGAAGENCPPEYLAPVLDAVCFLMQTHPDPTGDYFHVYKRFEQPSGFINIRVVVEELRRSGAQPNLIRAILNLHKLYGAQFGRAFLAFLKNAPKLMEYEGGILLLAADFADKRLSPALQEGIIAQAGKPIEYKGGALQLAVDLTTQRISAPLQAAIVGNCYALQDYPGGVVKLAEDISAGRFSESAQVGVVSNLISADAIRKGSVRQYITAIARIYAVNPVCIEAQFLTDGCDGYRYYTKILSGDAQLSSLAADTAVPNFSHLADKQRTYLFSVLLRLTRYPFYPQCRESALLLADKAKEWQGDQLETTIDRLADLSQSFDQSGHDGQPKATLPAAALLADDLATIVESDQRNIKGRWYQEALYGGASREDIMLIVGIPIGDGWSNRDTALLPCFDAIADRFLGDDAGEKKKLAPIVALLIREFNHYYLGINFGKESQPMGVMCRYIFGRGPEEENGVTIADIKQCETIFESRHHPPESFDEYFITINKISVAFGGFGDRLRLALRESFGQVYRDKVGYSIATETPIEWAYDYLSRDTGQRLPEEAAVLASPVQGYKLSLATIETLGKVAARLSQKYPTQADKFEQFVINLLMRHPSQERILGGGYEYNKALPGEGDRSIVIATANKPDLAGALNLARQLEASSVIAKPIAFPDLAPTILPRSVALALGGRVGNKAGRLLKIIGESVPVRKNRMINPDDDVGALWRDVLKARVARPGFPMMGAKLHVDKAVKTELVYLLMRELGLGTSPFSTIHAGMTLLLPPGQPIEIKLLLRYLKSKGLFNDRDFDMQACIGGRLQAKRHEASIGLLNAIMLLATRATPSYAVDAWSTKIHNKETNAYIMAYGDNIRVRDLPYDLSTPGDRTDMLGRRDLNDLDLYQIVATLIMHYEHGGYFADIGEQFVHRIVTILQRYELYDALFDAPWVFVPGVTPDTPNTTTLKHWEMVEAFTSMRMVAETQPRKGITGDVRREIRRAYTQAKTRFPDIVESDPAQFEKLCVL